MAESGALFGRFRWAPLTFEPLAFHVREGLWWTAPPSGLAEWYHRCTEEEVVARLAGLGVNLVSVHFFKGYGLRSPLEDHASTRKLIAACHATSIRVLAYVQMRSLVLSAFLDEQPDARDWISVDADGRPVTFGGSLKSYFRSAPCYNSRPFVDYIKRVLTVGLREFGADGIHLDNLSWHGRACHCPRCREGFRRYLATRFPGAALAESLGLTRVDHIEPPQAFLSYDPVCRAWIDYKRQVVQGLLEEISDTVKTCNPAALLCVHARYAWHMGGDYVLRFTVWPGMLAGRADLHVVENCSFPRITAEGELTSVAREHKLVVQLQVPAVPLERLPSEGRPASRNGGITFVPSPREAAVQMAAQMAFGGQVMGGMWITAPYRGRIALEDPGLDEVLRRYMAFHRSVEDLHPSVPYADVALFRPERALWLDLEATSPCLTGAEQMLLQGHIAWQPILSLDHCALTGYRALILPHASVMTDHEVAAVKQFVAAGGHLVVVGRAGTFDEHFRRRASAPLRELTGVDEDCAPSAPRVQTVGRAHVLYLPPDDFRPARTGDATLIPQLPLGWRDKVVLLDSTIGPAGVELDAPETVLWSPAVQQDRGRLLIWLVQVGPHRVTSPLSLVIRPEAGMTVRGAWTSTPEQPVREVLAFARSGGAALSVPGFDVLRLVGLDCDHGPVVATGTRQRGERH